MEGYEQISDTQLKQTELLVWDVLRESTKARNSDTFLILKIAERLGMTVYGKRAGERTLIHWELDLGLMPSFESITRARRKIQAGGQFLPTLPEVCRARRINEERTREYYARGTK